MRARFGDFVLDADRRQLFRCGEGVRLQPKTLELLELWEQRVIPLLEGDNVLGRDEGMTARIDVAGVSRRHACIRVGGGCATIEDLGSKNGTYLGYSTAPISGPVPLADAARFRLGRVLLVFRSSPEAGATLTERGA